MVLMTKIFIKKKQRASWWGEKMHIFFKEMLKRVAFLEDKEDVLVRSTDCTSKEKVQLCIK